MVNRNCIIRLVWRSNRMTISHIFQQYYKGGRKNLPRHETYRLL